MRDKKKILKFLRFLVPTSLLAAVAFYLLDVFVCTEIYQIFWSLCLNIFAGASVLFVTTMIEYNKNRRDVLEKLYLEYHKFYALLLNINPVDIKNYKEKEIDKYYALACESTKDLNWNFGQLDLFKKEKELDIICRSTYGFFRDLLKKFHRLKVQFDAVPSDMKVMLLDEIQEDLFSKEEKVEDGYKLVTYRSRFLSKLDKDLKIMLDKTNKKKFSEEECKERYELDKRLDYKGTQRIKL